MTTPFGRFARALLLTGGIATALALPSLAGAPLLPSHSDQAPRIALAAAAANNENGGDPTDDNTEERNLVGQVLELHKNMDPPEALIATTRENVWARIYKDQVNRSGMQVGDHVHLRGEYGAKGIFDAYQVDVDARFGDNGNDND